MPTYQYACTACGERSEVVQSFTDAPLTECSVCGDALRKVFSAVGVVFKGSGFYKTDSRSAAKSGASSESKGSGDSSTSSAPAASGDKAGAAAGSGSSSTGTKSSSSGSTTSTSAPASKSA